MGMTIDECIEIWTHPTQYFPSKREQAMFFAKNTMRKYQKIQEIVKEWRESGLLQDKFYDLINEVLEDGNDIHDR